MFDRKDLDDHQPIDTHLGRGGHFREIVRLLKSEKRQATRGKAMRDSWWR